jgi:hypothetical protein
MTALVLIAGAGEQILNHHSGMMINKIISILFVFHATLPLEFLSGQGQIDIPAYIRQKFDQYCESVPREEIYVQTDREQYIAGEDLWFKVYLTDRQKLKPSSSGRIAYFEVLNAWNKPVVQKRVLLQGGSGPGRIILPDTLSSGEYTIRTYTNWMKNFLPCNCFSKKIAVYNSLRRDPFKKITREFCAFDTSKYKRFDNPQLSFEVNRSGSGNIEIIIRSTTKFRSENNNTVYLFIQSNGNIQRLSREELTDDIITLTISENSMPTGICQATIFDSRGPVSDRYFYVQERGNVYITIDAPESARQRNKVAVEIESEGDHSILDNLSISVSDISETHARADMDAYFLFGTEFGSYPYGFLNGRKLNELSDVVMKDLMMNLKSNWIIWDSVFSDRKDFFRFPFETDVHFVPGRLLKGNLQPAGAEEVVLMNSPGRKASFQYSRTNNDGSFNLGIPLDEEFKDLIIQTDIGLNDQRIIIEPSFPELYYQSEVKYDSSVPASVVRQGIGYQVRKIFGLSSAGVKVDTLKPGGRAKKFYGKPDFELVMSDFVTLDSMQEVFFELVPNVSLEFVNSAYQLSVINPSKSRIEGDPCVMIDGIIVKDLKTVADLDPDLVEKIEVIWEKYRIGGYVFNGIVHIITKAGDFSTVPLPDNAVRLHYKVIDPPPSFVSPGYSSPESLNSPVADYRNTLYWNPNIRLDNTGKAKIEFWTSDVKSDYLIDIKGYVSGKYVSIRKSIKVE